MKFSAFKAIKSGQNLSQNSKKVILIIAEEGQVKGLSKKLALLGSEVSKKIEAQLSRRDDALKAGESLKILGANKSESDLLLAILPEKLSTFVLLGFAKKLWAESLRPDCDSALLVFLSATTEDIQANTLGAALATKTFAMPAYGKRTEKKKVFKIAGVEVYGPKPSSLKSFEDGFEEAYGTNLVRSLGAMPPNELNSKNYGKKIRELASQNGLQLKFYSNVELKKMGAGAFTAVDCADPDSAGGIYELTYSPARAKNKKPVTLVGKGICFDTGGYDVKTGGYMVNMKGDMQGSALALASLVVASRRKIPLKMKAFLAVTENHISPKGYKPDEVIMALNGISIEVINTDAEGRMVLADTLVLASRQSPELIIDYATLTGMATLAIGRTYSAGFTNQDQWHSKIVESGKKSGERVWTFPIDEDFGKALESPIADTIQCTKGRSPDHILAAVFLKKFVEKDVPWVHIDLSAADNDGGLAHVDTFFTGFGVRWTFEFLRSLHKI